MEAPQKMAEWEFELLAAGDNKYLFEQYLKPFEYIEHLEAELRFAPTEAKVRSLHRDLETLARENHALKMLAKAHAKFVKEIIK